jgi:hypothetical protein
MKKKIYILISLVILFIVVFLYWLGVAKLGVFAQVENTIVNQATVTYQDESGNTYTLNSNSVTVTIVPATGTTYTVNLSGLQGRTDGANLNFTIKIFDAGTTNEVFSQDNVVTDGSGQAIVPVSTVTIGQSYDIRIKPTTYLSKILTNQTAADSNTLSYDSFKNGDIDNNNQINIFDFSRLRSSWGTPDDNPNFNPSADLDNNNTVNIFDFSILRSNFGQDGS